MNNCNTAKSYCVYLTIYKGNKLPPFYIGSSSIKRISKHHYKGSVDSKEYRDIWQQEKLQNPHLFDVKIISRHATRIEAFEMENKLHKKLKVVESTMYVNMTYAYEHPNNKNRRLSTNHKQNLSKSLKGKPKNELTKARMRKPKTIEHNQKVSIAKLSMTPITCPHCNKSGNKAVMSRFHFDNCKHNPNNKITLFTCPHCNKTGRCNMLRYHFDNCKQK